MTTKTEFTDYLKQAFTKSSEGLRKAYLTDTMLEDIKRVEEILSLDDAKFLTAVVIGDLKAVETFIQDNPVGSLKPKEWPEIFGFPTSTVAEVAFTSSALIGHEDVIKTIARAYKLSPDMNLSDDERGVPLLFSIASAGSLNGVRALLELGADIDATAAYPDRGKKCTIQECLKRVQENAADPIPLDDLLKMLDDEKERRAQLKETREEKTQPDALRQNLDTLDKLLVNKKPQARSQGYKLH